MTATAPPMPVLPRVTIRALALLEARLLLRNRMLWLGVMLAAALCTAWGWTRQPDWHAFAANAGMAALVLAGFLMLLGHRAASRDHRYGSTETASALPTSSRQRTLALLALVPVGSFAGATAFGIAVLGLLPAWPAGVFDPWLVLITVTVPMTGAALGVAVGRWLPATAAGPLALFASAAVLGALPVIGSAAGDLPWLLFPVLIEAPGVSQPTAWHLLYLVAALVAVVAVVALRHRRRLPAVVLVAALAVAGAAVRQQSEHLEPAGPAAEAVAQDCERHGTVSYCALPGYGRWIPLWRAAVEPVVQVLPPAAGEFPAVRQSTGQPSGVHTGLSWGRHDPWATDSRRRLSQQYVRVLLGMPATAAGPEAAAEPACSGAGQLRTVVALWLVAQADPAGEMPRAGGAAFGPVAFGPAETEAAARLLDAPRQQVTAMLAEHWSAVRSPAPAGEVLAPFGVTGIRPAGDSPCP
jgi:hypothetical protein